MTNYRATTGYALEPMQQSMMQYPSDRRYAARTMLGVVLKVNVADDPDNYSSSTSADYRGFRHECLVQIVDDGFGNLLQLDKVVIPTPAPSGLGDYSEYLPKEASQFSDGSLDTTLASGDVYQLDGDWCLVGFVAGDINRPYISAWLPHPQNTHDLQTMGAGHPDANGRGSTLDQRGRVYRRVRGVEVVVSGGGDVYVDTTRAGAVYDPTATTADGRPPYKPSPDGGNIRVAVKEAASLELTWNTPGDGIGIGDAPDPHLPQINPKPNTPDEGANKKVKFTKVRATKDVIEFIVPSKLKIKTDDFVIDSSYGTIYLDNFEILADESIVINCGDVIIASENDLAEPLIKGSAADQVSESFLTHAAKMALSGTTAQNKAAIDAIVLFLNDLVDALANNQTIDFKAN